MAVGKYHPLAVGEEIYCMNTETGKMFKQVEKNHEYDEYGEVKSWKEGWKEFTTPV